MGELIATILMCIMIIAMMFTYFLQGRESYFKESRETQTKTET